MTKISWKAVLFDLDGTLYDYAVCHRSALKATALAAKVELGLPVHKFIKLYEESRQAVHDRLAGTAASHSRLLYFNELVFRCTAKSSIIAVTRLEKIYWSSFLNKMRPYSGVIPLLKRLRSESVQLALVTDMTAAIQFEKIRKLGLLNLFDVVVTSEETGCEKPDLRIFEMCLNRLGLGSGSVIYIGDDSERDVMGPQAAGLEFILFMPRAKVIPLSGVKVARSFSELWLNLIPDT